MTVSMKYLDGHFFCFHLRGKIQIEFVLLQKGHPYQAALLQIAFF